MVKLRLDKISPYLYLIPFLVPLSIFTIYPMGFSLYASLFRWKSLALRGPYVGISNYWFLLKDPDFVHSIQVTAIYIAISVFLSVGLGFILAFMCTQSSGGKRRLKGQSFWNSSFFFPYIIPWSATAMVWLWLFHPQLGFVNALFKISIDWVHDEKVALWAIIIPIVWKMIGYYFILFLAGLQQIPAFYYEAAKIDGARWHQLLRHITIPLLSPTLLFIGLISIVNGLEAIDLVYLMTQGGPAKATYVLLFFIYNRAFEYRYWDEAYAASTLLALVLMILTVLYFRVLERRVHYEIG